MRRRAATELEDALTLPEAVREEIAGAPKAYVETAWRQEVAGEPETVEQVWPTLAPLLFVPHTEPEYDHLVQMLDTLIDVVGEDETHRLASLMEIISVLIEKYEDEHVPELS